MSPPRALLLALGLFTACAESRTRSAADAGSAADGGSDAATAAADGGSISCGHRDQNYCQGAQYCDYVSGSECGADNAGGTCRPRPESCDAQQAPVCGCDARTYENACEAAMHSVSVVADGECPPIDCDYRKITCHRVAPECPPGLVPSVSDGCYGRCTPTESCPCTDSHQCPLPGSYTCDGAGLCTVPYV